MSLEQLWKKRCEWRLGLCLNSLECEANNLLCSGIVKKSAIETDMYSCVLGSQF